MQQEIRAAGWADTEAVAGDHLMPPGPATMRGLRWIAGVGPVSHEAWAAAMGWGESVTFRHAARLVAARWVERQAMTRGRGSLLYATREGIAVSAVSATALARAPAPTTWAHCEACGWVAAWLTSRGRFVVGPRELLAGKDWHTQLRWRERGTERRRGHRPDLLAAMSPGQSFMPVEVELTIKSTARLRAVLGAHARWISDGQATALVYICGNDALASRVRESAAPFGLTKGRRTLRVELLDTVRNAARQSQSAACRARAA